VELEPIRKMEDVKRMYDWLKENCTIREAECFLIGCNIALRAGDLLQLKFTDLEGEFIELREQKTNKYKKIPISKVVRDAVARLQAYYSSREFYKSKKFNAVYLFQSTGNRAYHLCQPICIQWLSACLKRAANALGFNVNINTHSMRKTWGYHAYEGGQDISYIQALFNHAHQRVTLNYIGVTRSAIEQMYRDNTMDLA